MEWERRIAAIASYGYNCLSQTTRSYFSRRSHLNLEAV